MNAKAIKVLLIVVALAGAGVITWFSAGRGMNLPSDYTLVDVATGQRFGMSRNQITEMPMPHPKTGERTLLLCNNRDGTWRVSADYKAALERLGDKNKYVDLQTLAIKSAP